MARPIYIYIVSLLPEQEHAGYKLPEYIIAHWFPIGDRGENSPLRRAATGVARGKCRRCVLPRHGLNCHIIAYRTGGGKNISGVESGTTTRAWPFPLLPKERARAIFPQLGTGCLSSLPIIRGCAYEPIGGGGGSNTRLLRHSATMVVPNTSSCQSDTPHPLAGFRTNTRRYLTLARQS